MKTIIQSLLGLGLSLGSLHPADVQAAEPVESKEHKHLRMAWWREARFGMFIHWGPYSILGGQYKGHTQKMGGAEWLMNRCKIPTMGFPGRDWETCMTMIASVICLEIQDRVPVVAEPAQANKPVHPHGG